MKRIAYFGTQGNDESGHHFRAIAGEFSYKEQKEVMFLDGGSRGFEEMFCGVYQFKFFRYLNYIGLAFPASPDDKRGNSRTIVLVEDSENRTDVLNAIESHPFLKTQFEKLCKIYDRQLPNL